MRHIKCHNFIKENKIGARQTAVFDCANTAQSLVTWAKVYKLNIP